MCIKIIDAAHRLCYYVLAANESRAKLYFRRKKQMTTIRKYLRSFTAAATALLIAVVGCVSISAKEFADVSDFSEQIDVLSDIGIIVGTSENEFSPNEKVTREQMALLMFRTMLGRQEAGEENSTKFTDLYDSTYHGAISWANAAGIIIGTSDTTFSPGKSYSRAEFLTLLWKATSKGLI